MVAPNPAKLYAGIAPKCATCSRMPWWIVPPLSFLVSATDRCLVGTP